MNPVEVDMNNELAGEGIIDTLSIIDGEIDYIVKKSELTNECADHVKRLLHDFIEIKDLKLIDIDPEYVKIMAVAGLWLVDKFIRDDHYYCVADISNLIEVDEDYRDDLVIETERDIFDTCGCMFRYVPRSPPSSPNSKSRPFWN